MSQLQSIVDMVLQDNELTHDDVSALDSDSVRNLELQAEKIPEAELMTFAVGEAREVAEIVNKYGVQGLSNYLDSLV